MSYLLRAMLGLVRGLLRGVLLAAVVACSVLVFGFVALWDWVGAEDMASP